MASDGPLLLRIREASDRYGLPVSSLYAMAASGSPGFIRRNRSLRIHREIFETWLAQQAGGGDGRAA